MKDFWAAHWLHSPPETQFVNSRRVILKKLCFGPVEVHIWFVTEDGGCWHEHQLLEDFQEGERRLEPVSPEALAQLLDGEIALCRRLHLEAQLFQFQEERERWT